MATAKIAGLTEWIDSRQPKPRGPLQKVDDDALNPDNWHDGEYACALNYLRSAYAFGVDYIEGTVSIRGGRVFIGSMPLSRYEEYAR